ncbi:hypothetical protein H0H81_001093 [Sphagnurus paluster]|uniref:Uncharacterized protein n=1 Tax=Sphagnurus paluster TaxID=117069 RepID=A0A9P7FMR9_9AGAR|nr:hypothetical protein H0H81_001093 [Sphagnurus paluster]
MTLTNDPSPTVQCNTYQKRTDYGPPYSPSNSWDEPSATPPLTPDSFNDPANLSPILTIESDKYENEEQEDEENRLASHLLEIKEGKKPARSICYDTLIEDAPGHSPSNSFQIENDTQETHPAIAAFDDRDEWYGLEYTLELSCRQRLPSDTKSAGEHSRSRESWAAIHQGSIHPFFEDEEYYHWKNWHRHLDRQDERRKHRRGWAFKAHSKELAWFYVDEMRTRDVMYWQKVPRLVFYERQNAHWCDCMQEVYGAVAREVKYRLKTLAQHRPDPYCPPKKHNLGWYLKRSRSVACLRELRPTTTPPQYEPDDVDSIPPEDAYSDFYDVSLGD